MKEFKISTYDFDPYANGLLKAIEQTILVCQNKIDKIKEDNVDYKSPLYAHIGGQLRAYNIIKVNLINKRNKILKAKALQS